MTEKPMLCQTATAVIDPSAWLGLLRKRWVGSPAQASTWLISPSCGA